MFLLTILVSGQVFLAQPNYETRADCDKMGNIIISAMQVTDTPKTFTCEEM